VTAPTAAPPSGRRRAALRRIARFLERTLAVVGLSFLLYHGCFDVSVIAEGSMQPTLQGNRTSGDWILAEKVSRRLSCLSRWDVVAFRNNEGIQVMKRVVGLPGETVGIADSRVLINGKVVEIPAKLSFLRYYDYGNVREGKTVACGRGYYVMGDDSKDSEDSRYEGPIEPERLFARAWLRVWPWSRIGWVSP